MNKGKIYLSVFVYINCDQESRYYHNHNNFVDVDVDYYIHGKFYSYPDVSEFSSLAVHR